MLLTISTFGSWFRFDFRGLWWKVFNSLGIVHRETLRTWSCNLLQRGRTVFAITSWWVFAKKKFPRNASSSFNLTAKLSDQQSRAQARTINNLIIHPQTIPSEWLIRRKIERRNQFDICFVPHFIFVLLPICRSLVRTAESEKNRLKLWLIEKEKQKKCVRQFLCSVK